MSSPSGSLSSIIVEQLGARRPVDGGVVELRQDREPVVGKSLDDVALPERPAPVERPTDDPRDQLGELFVGARRRAARCAARGSRGRSRGPRSRTDGRGRTARSSGGAAMARAGGGDARSAPARPCTGRSQGRRAARTPTGSTRGRTASRSPCRGRTHRAHSAASSALPAGSVGGDPCLVPAPGCGHGRGGV